MRCAENVIHRAAPGRIVIEAARAPCRFRQKNGFIAIDQLRTIDRERVGGKLGRLTPAALGATLTLLQELFAP